MTTGIDLSRLARPDIPGLALSLDEAHAAILRYLADTHGWTVGDDASDPAWRLTRAVAGREVLMRQAVADAVAETSLAYATGDRLDHIGVTYYLLGRLAGEEDAAYRERLAGAPERYAVGLSGPWYESVARGVAGVRDARVTSPTPGIVRIFVLADEGLLEPDGVTPTYPDGIPSAGLLTAVTAAVTAPETRQQTDTVEVRACTRQRYDVAVTLTLYAEPDSGAALAAARAALRALAARSARLGASLTSEIVAGACVNAVTARAADITISTVDSSDVATEVSEIAGVDSVAPASRILSVSAL